VVGTASVTDGKGDEGEVGRETLSTIDRPDLIAWPYC
jgi:hypothetical protein